jgi:hypothetical protein
LEIQELDGMLLACDWLCLTQHGAAAKERKGRYPLFVTVKPYGCSAGFSTDGQLAQTSIIHHCP